MLTPTVNRLSGLALLLALPLQVLAGMLHPPSHAPIYLTSITHLLSHSIDLISWLLVLLGLIALYGRQAHCAGVLGLIGFVLTMLNAVAHVDLLIYETFTAPVLASMCTTRFLVAPNGPLADGPLGLAITLPLLALGPLLFGIATVRSGVLPRLAGYLPISGLCVALGSVPLMIVGLLDVPPVTVVYALMFLGYAWGGYTLLAKCGRRDSERPAVARQKA
jgi:hypothetical protein